MNDSISRSYVLDITKKLGISVEEIPESEPKKSPDFEFYCGDECTLVELKSRISDWDLSKKEIEILDKGGVIDRHESIGAHSTISSRIADASEQLLKFQTERHAFRLIWYFTHGQFSELAADRVRATLIGDITIFDADSERQWRACFFDHSQFFRHREVLDGAIVSSMSKNDIITVQLILNPLSPRYELFRCSKLSEMLSACILNPFIEEDMLVVGADANRDSEQDKLDYLALKYNIKNPFIIRMSHIAAAVEISHS
jgi:hypothetical protein